MPQSVEDQVVDYFGRLFGRTFSEPFEGLIEQRLKRNALIRQVGESGDAASQSLTRFFLNEKLSPEQVTDILRAFGRLADLLKPEDIANPNVTPESVVEDLLPNLPCPASVEEAGRDAVYRVALHSIVQVLMLVAPVMAEWRKVKFSTTFELPRRVVKRLNQISAQLAEFGSAGEQAADERYELTYRDYLLQRFHRVEAGTVRMTTNLAVDLRELFVMPKVRPCPRVKKSESADDQPEVLMDLAIAREVFARESSPDDGSESEKEEKIRIPALEQVMGERRCVIVGPPGSGKSTFLEWLQLQVASVEEPFVLAGEQAIPLLLRVRQLDPKKLPRDAALIQRATESQDRAALMPNKWLDRHMRAGRVLFMLDGLDETDVELRDRYVLPWLLRLIDNYPDCGYVISSRPVGYPAGLLRKLKFVECDLLDFDEPEIGEYTRHWCTAVHLAQQEHEDEARREGDREGREIVEGFKGHPYIRDLARNPLMLSAICLVNYFEGGELPQDRAALYRLCVEGLVHYWDKRRGIRSEYSLDEKLRVCREVALAMQADDKAEFESSKVLKVFEQVLGDEDRAKKLLEHIRYRTGLLVERRADVFAFAHLTFQEYLAARAVHEGNRRGVTAEQLAGEHADARWKEVIALYCGLVPAPAALRMLETLISAEDTEELGSVLAEAYLSSGQELGADQSIRRAVIARVARAPLRGPTSILSRFPGREVGPIANEQLGRGESNLRLTDAYLWLFSNTKHFDKSVALTRCSNWRSLNPMAVAELIIILHRVGSSADLRELATDQQIYSAKGPSFASGESYATQAEMAVFGLAWREPPIPDVVPLEVLRALARAPMTDYTRYPCSRLFERLVKTEYHPEDSSTWAEFARLARRVAGQLSTGDRPASSTIVPMTDWAKMLEKAIAKRKRRPAATKAKRKPKVKAKRPTKPGTRKSKTTKKSAKRKAKKKTIRRKKK